MKEKIIDLGGYLAESFEPFAGRDPEGLDGAGSQAGSADADQRLDRLEGRESDAQLA